MNDEKSLKKRNTTLEATLRNTSQPYIGQVTGSAGNLTGFEIEPFSP